MAEKKRPVARIVYKDADGNSAEVATLWEGKKFSTGTSYNLSAVTEAVDGEYPKMPLARALELYSVKNEKGYNTGFLNLYFDKALEVRPVDEDGF